MPGDFDCPQVGTAGQHSDEYYDDGGTCVYCGAVNGDVLTYQSDGQPVIYTEDQRDRDKGRI